MRTVTTLTLLLLLPLAASSQEPGASETGHFKEWPGMRPGADKQTFDVKLGVRHVDATFTVAKNGFGWRQAFTSSNETFRPWGDVTAWCWAPGTLLFRTQQDSPLRAGVYDVKAEDLATIVDAYFKTYVPEAEWRAPGWECAPAGLSRPNPADMSKVRELLEAASTETQQPD